MLGTMKGRLLLMTALAASGLFAEKEYIWPDGKMPDVQPRQIAAMASEARHKGFDPDEWRRPYLDWFAPPAHPNGSCMILISGGSYRNLADAALVAEWGERLTALGCQCVNLVYRTPWPDELPIYQTAWEDGQRAVRIVRSQAARRGYFPEKIGAMSISAGSHLATLLATSSLTPAYAKIDSLDDMSCSIDAAVAFSPSFVLTDGETRPNTREGDAPDIRVADCFKFDAETPPMCLLHGGSDIHSPLGSTKIYRELRKRGIPAEIHIEPGRGHVEVGFDRAVEFLRQIKFLGPLDKEVPLMGRFASDAARSVHEKKPLWPKGMVPDPQRNQSAPYLEWHIPSNLTTKAIQIIWSGGGYHDSGSSDFEVAPIRRYLNAKGMAVVTVTYRHPRPQLPLPKHISAWQDAQRAIKIVRNEAARRGLDPDDIGVMGFSAGGHLALLCATTSMTDSYWPMDDIDKIPCDVQWAVAVYPAYSLTDGLEKPNANGGNGPDDRLAPEFAFDVETPPILFLHGDADPWSAMNSVKAWEQLRRMGVQGELHTFATRKHGFQRMASPGTGSYTWMDRVWDFQQHRRQVARRSPMRHIFHSTMRQRHMKKSLLFLILLCSIALGAGIAYNTPPGDRRVTLAPDIAKIVVVADLRLVRDNSRHFVFQANLVNNSDRMQMLECRVVWLGENGLEIASMASNWRFKILSPNEVSRITAVAPVEYACDFRFYAQAAKPTIV